VRRENIAFYEKKLSFSIILFFKSTCHLSHFEWNKKGPPFSLDVTPAQPQEEKNLAF